MLAWFRGRQAALLFAVLAACTDSNEPDVELNVLLNHGDGTFVSRVRYGSATTTPQTPYVSLADFDGDGKLDIAAFRSNDGGELNVLLGNGDGTFRVRSHLIDYEGPLAVSDFNSDGKADLVVELPGNRIRLLLGRGDGSFEPGVDVGVEVPNTGALGGAQSIAVGDFNNDGLPDVVVASLAFACSIYLGNGDGTFVAQEDIALSGWPLSVEVADFDHDGKSDVAVMGGFLVGPVAHELLQGRGDGTFQVSTIPSMAAAAAAADFDRDGYPDLALVGGLSATCGSAVFLNEKPGTF